MAGWERLTAEPEMVSLDELLEDEEAELLATDEEDWEERPWAGGEGHERLH